ncbi:DUF3310 domain-containing protein [Paraburkholderia kirstenboschensis]|uniref:DUF3310 domain-containing protein n=1 Tax=Paraburkholderia kirstenboschensis TaxID=1245436 RepID=A0ABZ0ESS2_9BURK|nr:DUF3310 domain-containing protein [Paraburkholderia kirstenboschensis]WOD19820.1 DUF3310 domain-containing protein [Paraburkholderia kirstenboschensis]
MSLKGKVVVCGSGHVCARAELCIAGNTCAEDGKSPTIRDHAPPDSVNHPKHYTQHPSGVECIQITEHMGFNLGNAVKYVWRADLKSDAVEDLKKARWYIDREIQKREKAE